MKRKLIKRNKAKFSYEFKQMRFHKANGKRLVYVNMFPFYGIDKYHMVPKYVFPTRSEGIIHDWESVRAWFGLMQYD